MDVRALIMLIVIGMSSWCFSCLIQQMLFDLTTIGLAALVIGVASLVTVLASLVIDLLIQICHQYSFNIQVGIDQ